MTIGSCRLCGTVSELQESHVIPKFVYKWMKETSGTGYLRFGMQPNKRAQDGYKFYWLCEDCEQRLNNWETEFSKRIFHPFIHDDTDQAQYGTWFLPFCVSISWRVLNLFMEQHNLDHFSEKHLKSAERAREVWKEFLLGKRPHPEKYEQHFLPMNVIESYTYPDMPPNINRYILRSVDIDAACNEKSAIIYSKLGRFVIIGFLEEPHPNQWVGTKVHVKSGVVGQRKYILPEIFGNYFANRAKRINSIYEKISEKQNKKIEETFLKDLDRAAESESFKAIDHDVRLFGKAAFKKEK